MPDSRKHRGPHPRDPALFGPEALPALRAASADLSYLLARGYAPVAALKLVGDRHTLSERQRKAVNRCAATDAEARGRRDRRCAANALADAALWIDGLNVITTLEVALSGGVILVARDDCYRDIAGVHGTYRRVEETRPALALLGEHLASLGLSQARFLLDRPVSNSGRLAVIMRQLAEEKGWPWQVELVNDPDRVLMATDVVVASADREILDRAPRWYNLAREIIEAHIPDAFVVDLSREDADGRR